MTFLDAAVISTARQSCPLTPAELCSLRNANPSDTVKLPACHGMLMNMRSQIWDRQPWSGDGPVSKMTYLACVWGFDQSARISESTVPEPRAQDHCIQLDEDPGRRHVLRRQRSCTEARRSQRRQRTGGERIGVWGKKAKLMGRLSPDESLFLIELR